MTGADRPGPDDDGPALALASLIPSPWRSHLTAATEAATFATLARYLREKRTRADIYPPEDDTFAALRLVPPDGVRAVILGQDPYHQLGQAHGLAFSVPVVVKAPPSFRNILIELGEPDAGPSLEPWARRGVLLLNTVLTVELGTPGSHRGRGWEEFTDQVIRTVDRGPDPVAFLLWGRVAQAKARLINRERHIVHEAPHPSESIN